MAGAAACLERPVPTGGTLRRSAKANGDRSTIGGGLQVIGIVGIRLLVHESFAGSLRVERFASCEPARYGKATWLNKQYSCPVGLARATDRAPITTSAS